MATLEVWRGAVAETDASTIDALAATSVRALPIVWNSGSVAAES